MVQVFIEISEIRTRFHRQGKVYFTEYFEPWTVLLIFRHALVYVRETFFIVALVIRIYFLHNMTPHWCNVYFKVYHLPVLLQRMAHRFLSWAEYPLTLELPLAAINWTVNSNTADADTQAIAHQTPQATAMKKSILRFVFSLFHSIISPLIGGLVFLWHDPYIRFSVSCPVASQCVFIIMNKVTTLGYAIQ